MVAAPIPKDKKWTCPYVEKLIIIHWHMFVFFSDICNIKHRLGCKYSSQNIFNTQNFNPDKRPIPLIRSRQCPFWGRQFFIVQHCEQLLSWWRHQMENIFFDLRLNKRLNKQWWGRWFETPSCPLWRHCNVPLLPTNQSTTQPIPLSKMATRSQSMQRTWWVVASTTIVTGSCWNQEVGFWYKA